jgi:hypothetical protein
MTDRNAAKWDQVRRRLDELQHQLDRLEPFRLKLMPV